MSARPRRSAMLLAVGALLAVATGIIAAKLRGEEPAGESATGGLSFPAQVGEPTPDAEVFRARLLEQLIEQARIETAPARLPLFRSFSDACARDLVACASVLARLGEPDVPFALRRDFAQALPMAAGAAADALLLDALPGTDADAALQALSALLARQRALVGTEAACGCAFGLLPRDAAPGDRVTLFAFAAEGHGLRWAPELGDAWAVLRVRPDAQGPRLLLMPWSMPAASPAVRASADGPAAQAPR